MDKELISGGKKRILKPETLMMGTDINQSDRKAL